MYSAWPVVRSYRAKAFTVTVTPKNALSFSGWLWCRVVLKNAMVCHTPLAQGTDLNVVETAGADIRARGCPATGRAVVGVPMWASGSREGLGALGPVSGHM